MRNISILLFAFLVFGFSITEKQPTECKKWGGVYKSPDSYLKKQLSDSVCIENKGNSVYEGLLNKIVIKTGKEKITFNPGDIFAYSDGANIYRYFETTGAMSAYGYFKIEDTLGLIIYSQIHRSYRHSSTAYYYSKDINASIKLLTVSNLEQDFKNDEFINEIKKLKNITDKSGVTFEVNISYRKHFR
ncbi:MAG: hypothetical protein IT232_11525 [Flavobacteriales bacterium]|nr:hypothetical protein [Flavobacteriales bacterium]